MAKEKTKTELPQVMEGELQARLIKLREDAGFDVSQMANALCLSEEVINNLENESFELLPEPPYVRGYLRNYAKLGDDDPSELISRYESLRGADIDELDFQIKPTNTISSSQKKRISPIWAQVIMLALLIGGIGVLASIPEVNTWVKERWQSFSSKLKPSSSINNPSLLGELPVPTPLPENETLTPLATTNTNATPTAAATAKNQPSSTNTQGTENNTQNTSNNAAAVTANTDTNPTPTEIPSNNTASSQTETSKPVAKASTEQTVAAASTGVINIKLVFNKEVWLRIKNKDNKTVFEGLNKAATEKTIALKKPLTFRVGNAQGLSLFIDNKAVDISSYTNGSIANFTLE